MKHRCLIAMLIMFLFLSGCHRTVGEETLPSSSDTSPTEISTETADTSVESIDSSTETTVEHIEESTAPTIPEGATPLTKTDIAWFNSEFFATEVQDGVTPFNIRNMFLSPQYESPAEINLLELFYDGTARDMQITQEEIDAFDKATGRDVPLDNVKIPKGEMERIFLENTGITIEQSQKNGLDSMTYLEKYDAYYIEHGDTGYALCQIQSGYVTDEGLTVLLYQKKYREPFGTGQVVLSLIDGGYWFVSNWFDPFF